MKPLAQALVRSKTEQRRQKSEPKGTQMGPQVNTAESPSERKPHSIRQGQVGEAWGPSNAGAMMRRPSLKDPCPPLSCLFPLPASTLRYAVGAQ